MPALLPEDVMDWSVIERIMCDVITPGDQLYDRLVTEVRDGITFVRHVS